MTTDTEMTKNVTRGQVRQYLRTIGKDPDDDVFRDIIESMEDEVEEDEWDDLAAQFRAAGAEVDMEKASQMTPGMTTPGPTMASDTTPGPTRVAPGHRREATIVGMGAIPATEPEDGGAIGAFSAPPGPVSPIHVAPRPVPPTEPAVPPDDEDHRPTLPHADVSAAAASSEWHQRPPAAPAPSPVVGPAPAGQSVPLDPSGRTSSRRRGHHRAVLLLQGQQRQRGDPRQHGGESGPQPGSDLTTHRPQSRPASADRPRNDHGHMQRSHVTRGELFVSQRLHPGQPRVAVPPGYVRCGDVPCQRQGGRSPSGQHQNHPAQAGFVIIDRGCALYQSAPLRGALGRNPKQPRLLTHDGVVS